MRCESVVTDMECALSAEAVKYFKKDEAIKSDAEFCAWHYKGVCIDVKPRLDYCTLLNLVRV